MSKLVHLALILLISVIVNSDLIPNLTSEPINSRVLQTQFSEEMFSISPETLNQLLRGYLRYYNLHQNPPCAEWDDTDSIFDDFDSNSTELIDENIIIDDTIHITTWEDLINNYTTPLPPNPYYTNTTTTKPKTTNTTTTTNTTKPAPLPTLGDLIINYSALHPSQAEAIFSSLGSKLPNYSNILLDEIQEHYFEDSYSQTSSEDLRLSGPETLLFIKLLKKSGLVIVKQ